MPVGGPLAGAGTVTPTPVAGVTFTPSSLSFASGATASQTFTANAAADGTVSIAITNTLGLANSGSPISYTTSAAVVSADWIARRTGANVIWYQGFDTTSEVTAFANPPDADLNAVALYREDDSIVGSALVFKFIGGKLTADFLASGGNGPRTMVLDDASEWPTTFPFKFFVSKLPDTGPDKKTLFSCTGRSGNNLTVTYVPLGASEFDSGGSFTDRFIGDAAGSECPNYIRPFSALSSADTGLAANDAAAGGTLPVRSRIVGNASYVPQVPGLFGYGYCAHPDYASDSRYAPWVPNYQGTGSDSTPRVNIIDTNEVFIQFRMWLDPNSILPDMVGGKLFGIQTETTVPQQIVMGNGPGATLYQIPSTPEIPFGLAKFAYGSYGSAGLVMAANPYSPNGSSFQPGSFEPVSGKSWEATAIYANSNAPSTGQNTPDGSSAFELKYGRWVTFQWRIKPGKNWHYSVPLKNAWNSATQSTLTLLDAPDEWPTSNFQILVEYTSNTFNVASRSGAVLSGITLASGANVNLVALDTSSIIKIPATPAGSAALNTLLEVKFADYGDTQYTTLFSVSDHPIVYGSRGQYAQFFDTAIPGFNAIVFWGYHNSELSVSSAPYKTLKQKFAQVICSKAEIAVPAVLPAWVPAPGRVAVLTTTNGYLTNTFASQVPSHYAAFYSKKIVNDYSGGAANPYYGTYGAMIFEGGGHAATNDNSVIQLELGLASCAFRRIVTGTNWFPGTPSNNDVGNVSGLYDTTWTEATADGKPISRHSYGDAVVIPPASGGAAYGTYMFAFNAGSAGGFIPANMHGPHKLDIGSLGGTYTWARSASAPSTVGTADSPFWSCFVPAQNRIYVHKAHSPSVYWQNRSDNSFGYGTGAGLPDDVLSAGGVNGAMLRHIPSRDLLIFAYPGAGSVLNIRYMSVGASDTNPGWVSTKAALSVAIGADADWSTIDWVPRLNKLIVGKVAGDPNCVYEIDIPATLTNSWTCTRRGFTGGDTIPWVVGGTGYGRWSYIDAIRGFAYLPVAVDSGTDTVYVYRPLGT